MYGKEEMINKVKEQFSKDFGCSIEDLNKNENVISHAFSKNTSINAGFKPAWVEIYSD